MLKLVRGDLLNLEGRVIVYSLYEGNIPSLLQNKQVTDIFQNLKNREIAQDFKENPLLAIYATTTIRDLFEGMNLPQEAITQFLKTNNSFKQYLNNFPHPLFLGVMPPVLETDICISCKGDVLFAGAWSNPVSALTSVQCGVHLYMAHYNEQNIHKASELDANKNSENSTSKIIRTQLDVSSLKDIPPVLLRRYIYKEFVAPMIDAMGNRDNTPFEKLHKKFSYLSKGTPYGSDIDGICSVLKNTTILQAAPIIGAYLSKMQAIHTEKFEEAAQLRDQIRDLEANLSKKVLQNNLVKMPSCPASIKALNTPCE